jgi:hypothetical protein
VKLLPMRRDGHTAYVQKSQLAYMISHGWKLIEVLKVKS